MVRPSCESRSALSPMHVPHFGHHALSCKNGSDVVSRHNRIRDTLFEFCQLPASSCAPKHAHAWVHNLKLEAVWVMKLNKHILLMSSSLTGSWASLLHLIFVSHPRLACVISSSAAMQSEQRKHHSNDAKCGELG